MAMKECSAFPKASASLKPHNQIIQDTRWVGYRCRDAVGVFYCPSRLGSWKFRWKKLVTILHLILRKHGLVEHKDKKIENINTHMPWKTALALLAYYQILNTYWGVMLSATVNVVRNGHVQISNLISVQILGEFVCVSFRANAMGKAHPNPLVDSRAHLVLELWFGHQSWRNVLNSNSYNSVLTLCKIGEVD